jgi:hypothetical protein
VNVVFVAEARHAARLVPTLLAVGAAGWALAVRGRAADAASAADGGRAAPAPAAGR